MKKLLTSLLLVSVGSVYAASIPTPVDIPASSMIPVKVLIGGDLTKTTTPDSPFPVVLLIQNNSLAGCKINASAYPDFASGRAMIKTNKIVCDNTEVAIHGYVAGSDDKAGIQGTKSLKTVSINKGTEATVVVLDKAVLK